jgi:hypothetical protein
MVSDAKVRFKAVNIEDNDGDYWFIDNVELTATSTPDTTISGTLGYVDEINNDTSRGYVTTGWQNFTDGSGITPDPVNAGGLKLKNVDAELNGGEISVWVQSDNENDGTPENESDEIELDPGKGVYDVGNNYQGNLTNSYRYRLKAKVDHPDTTDSPRFYDAELVG